MARASGKLLSRDDTFLGVCEGIGGDLGIPANLLRLAFAGMLFWNWSAALMLYFGLAAVLYTVRWFIPDRAVRPEAPARDAAPGNDTDAGDFARAA